MICGLGIRDAIRALWELPAELKWPNDITLRGRKVGGILTEVSTSGTNVDYVITGVGLNVNMTPSMLPHDWDATSISQELGRTVARLPLLQTALWQIEQRYTALRNGQWPAQDWAAALETLGRRVELRTSEGTWRGVATGVDNEGALTVRLDNGQSRRVLEGDVVLRDDPRREASREDPAEALSVGD
jgi:BirA family biotin operon repressor/biotin-[acetyl-CoA-carboxylase] ligase